MRAGNAIFKTDVEAYEASELCAAEVAALKSLMPQTVILPWPPAALSPNARVHWATKSRAAKSYRLRCHVYASSAKLVAPAGRILLELVFCPPSNRRRDDDNLLAAFKAGRDGLADALKIDDSRFVSQVRLSDEVVKGGCVRVTLRPYVEAV